MVNLIWLIPLIPLMGAAVLLTLGRLMPKAAIQLLAPGTILATFLLSLGAVMESGGKSQEVILYEWLPKVDWGFLLDPLSSVMILIVTGIGFLIHVYAVGYMNHEGGYYRFFGYMNLFVFFMLTLVLANNYVLLFAGWEGVGLASYLLIGFYFSKKSAGDAAKKAFLFNRVGDAGFILGMFCVTSLTHGSLAFRDLHGLTAGPVLSAAAALLFLGATGKSAQLPLFVWLPDAMEGPTPVSALIHAATMVTAGVYMVARSNAIYTLAPEVSFAIAVIGALTAIVAASIAIVQTDIKRVLAYSTVSQLGFMFMAAGVGAYWVAVFHLMTHAFFKALLFLGAGSVIHGLNGEQDMRRMGGLHKEMPITFWTMAIASLSIAGVPLLAGFFSKDEILFFTFLSAKSVFAVGLVTAFLTAFYMSRMMFLTFLGEQRNHAHAHESLLVMTAPLMILAVGSVVSGWIGGPLERWLEPVLHTSHAPEEGGLKYLVMGFSVVAAGAGILLARYFYISRPELPAQARIAFGPLTKLADNKWYFDDLYDALFVHGLGMKGGALLGSFDRQFVDGGINGAGLITRFASHLSIWFDTWIVDGLVRLTGLVTKAAGYPIRMAQTGYVQSYAMWIIAAAAAALGFFWVR